MVVTHPVDQLLERAVAAGEVTGIVALAASDDGPLYEGAFGTREIGGDAAMTPDTVMWIASMTKAVTAVAAMQLVERGQLALDEPLGKRFPDLAAPRVLEGFDDAGVPRLRAARQPVTLRRLLTHTAGFSYNTWDAGMLRYMTDAHIPPMGECKASTLAIPLVFDPGERFEYGINLDWVGRIVELISGQRLEEYFREHILDPLEMNDTSFLLGPEQRMRLANMHERQPDGLLVTIPFAMPCRPELYSGGGGLYSTGPDYLRFLRMLLAGGALDGARVLQPETVAEMSRNQIGDVSIGQITSAIPSRSNDFEFFPGIDKKWGLACMITMAETPTGRSAGSLTWAGLANTYYWIDPARCITGVLMTQVFPFADATVLDLFARFECAIYAGVAETAGAQAQNPGGA